MWLQYRISDWTLPLMSNQQSSFEVWSETSETENFFASPMFLRAGTCLVCASARICEWARARAREREREERAKGGRRGVVDSWVKGFSYRLLSKITARCDLIWTVRFERFGLRSLNWKKSVRSCPLVLSLHRNGLDCLELIAALCYFLWTTVPASPS